MYSLRGHTPKAFLLRTSILFYIIVKPTLGCFIKTKVAPIAPNTGLLVDALAKKLPKKISWINSIDRVAHGPRPFFRCPYTGKILNIAVFDL